ncbi:homoserine O-succinyltransferase [Sharpea azabuensis]|jgi:homoserine O-succinyltransferase|uniref:Homoserine O-acetyltransferase n=1 Tax=Sharpea porci TaxID=2652286 RepID=A0A844FS57_9FIRM|nr:homoserine O-succinyltransferase [Sharpea porci]MDD6712264.1 homoserine O-succinyltransferase [Sharpea porci]MDY5278442.1 homoserine O-succinyltransferase [Sharpea porci]MST88747.1 homoserine O-succinyltransferase [Sharpea porci]
MPINLPDDLPAGKILRDENVFVMNTTRATTQQIRPLHVMIVNLMPTKEVTETQLLRLLSNTPLQVEVDLIRTATHTPVHVNPEHLKSFYKFFDDVKDQYYDGMIITGAPVERMAFEDVDYWKELCDIMEWAKTHVFSSFFICWGAQAALHYYYGLDKYLLKHKLTGVYRHHINTNKMKRKILRGFDYEFYAPHSRYTTVLKEDIASVKSLDILAESDEAGVYLVAEKDGSRFFVTGHSEYDTDTLDKEYKRDLANPNIVAEIPKNYYHDDDPTQDIQVKWRSHAYLLFANWLNYYVYQETPYKIEEIQKRAK